MVSLLAVFWYYKESFYGDELPLNSPNIVTYGEYQQLDSDHFFIWDRYRSKMGLPRNLSYEAIPRGRVLFHIPTHRFIVVGSKAICNNQDVQEKLIRFYGLPGNTEFRWDEHYR